MPSVKPYDPCPQAMKTPLLEHDPGDSMMLRSAAETSEMMGRPVSAAGRKPRPLPTSSSPASCDLSHTQVWLIHFCACGELELFAYYIGKRNKSDTVSPGRTGVFNKNPISCSGRPLQVDRRRRERCGIDTWRPWSARKQDLPARNPAGAVVLVPAYNCFHLFPRG